MCSKHICVYGMKWTEEKEHLNSNGKNADESEEESVAPCHKGHLHSLKLKWK